MNSQESNIARTGVKDLELTGSCPLKIAYVGSDEYQLPTQKHREQLHKSRAASKSHTHSNKCGRKNHFKITDKILTLYNTPDKREIPLQQARIIAAKYERTCQENSCRQLCLPILKDQKSKQFLDVSKSLVNEVLKKSSSPRPPEMKHEGIDSIVSLTTDDTQLILEHPCVSHSKDLANIPSSHPKFAKEIKDNPDAALKINSLIPTERLKGPALPTSPPKIKFPSIEKATQADTATPKYWLKYLNKKIANRQTMPSTCKLFELNPEPETFVKHMEQGKGKLHMDLKRLTEVRSKNWSSHGHYTRVHRLKYTKRQKSLMKGREKHVEVDEDYLSVDVDKLMNIYEEGSNPDAIASKTASGYIKKQNDPKLSCGIQSSGSFKACLQSNKDNENTREGSIPLASLQRPTTTTLRSCISFTCRKTCFANIT